MSGFPVAAPSVLPSATFAGPGLPFFGGGGGPTPSGSSISGGGATVACNDPVGSGSITVTGSQSLGVAGDINIVTKSTVSGSINLDATAGAGDISLAVAFLENEADGSITLDASKTAGEGGIVIVTPNTVALFEGTGNTLNGVTGGFQQIAFGTLGNYPANVSIGGAVVNTGLYVSNSQLLFNGAAVGGGGGGSSITGGGAVVVCDSPAGSGAITVGTTSTGTDGSIYLISSAATVGAIVGQGQDVGLAANSGGSGVVLKSPACAITLDANQLGQPIAGGANFPAGVDSQMVLSTSSTNAGTVSIGGAVNNTGLYVSNSQLLYNGTAVGGILPESITVQQIIIKNDNDSGNNSGLVLAQAGDGTGRIPPVGWWRTDPDLTTDQPYISLENFPDTSQSTLQMQTISSAGAAPYGQPVISTVMSFCGAWVSGTPYQIGMVVLYSSVLYLCILAPATSSPPTPDADPSKWKPFN